MGNAAVVFVGPSAYGLSDSTFENVEVRPPVRRGDIDDLVKSSKSVGVIAVVDGTFHSTLSVGHTEILGALRKGWEIWGLSSMGAIRAAEMHHLGMRGFGDVFDRYVADPDFSDDEVTMLHSPTEPYVSFSEPMIHIRQFVDHLAHREIISVNDADEAKSFFKNRWYGDRSLGRLRQYLIREQALPVSLLDEEMGAFERFRVKTIDLARFMEVCPWKSRPNATTQG